ncbi:hypothetical protein AOXY_G30654 [Acipenser oxyrinchus oxyrinchus]|uniref:Junctophilin 3 n=1 Tax=Acipenser oxyrinchus oxyrinchus TaxID=40147 RepID=A0AAD8CK09_ACIOX|nr:hypothetical protein AOXY_G30654 [Acipenser oxyrinchus oxyrinchus]
MSGGGRVFDFADGGSYVGAGRRGAHAWGCARVLGRGEYWELGARVRNPGVYSTPAAAPTWASGPGHAGTVWGAEKREGPAASAMELPGEWTQGHRGPLGVREAISGARYEGSWSPSGQQNEYGTETYTDGGTYIGQWVNGRRHGFGVRQSAPYRQAAVLHSPRRSSLNSVRSDKGPETSKTSKNSAPSLAVATPTTTAQLNNNGSAGRELEEPESIPSVPDVNFQTLRKTNQKKIENSEANNHNHTQESKPQSRAHSSRPLNTPAPPPLGAPRLAFSDPAAVRPQPASGAGPGRGGASGGRQGPGRGEETLFLPQGAVAVRHGREPAAAEGGERREQAGFFLRRTSLLSGLRLPADPIQEFLVQQRSFPGALNEGEGEGEEEAGKERTVLDSDQALFQVSDGSVTEVYSGEWRLDKRSGFGQSRRSDGLSYEGAWLGNRRHGYGADGVPGREVRGGSTGERADAGGPAGRAGGPSPG